MRIRLPHPFTLAQLSQYMDVPLTISSHGCPLQAVLSITTDSREVEAGDLFVTIDGDRPCLDSYIDEACQRGAGAILCTPRHGEPLDIPYFLAKQPLEAIASLASWYLKEVSPRVIAITGSVGKTTTRHLLSCILATRYRVHESPKNYNNLLGCCLTILTMPPKTDYLVIECGMDGMGQISRLSRLLKPDAAIITNVGHSHIGKLGSLDAICRAKLEITDGMQGGPLFYTGDAELLASHVPHTAIPVMPQPHQRWPYITHLSVTSKGTTFDYVSPVRYLKNVEVPALGSHIASCAMLAIALAEREGIDSLAILEGCRTYEPVENRLKVYTAKNVTIIDDSYNASPASMRAAAEVLSILGEARQSENKIAVLGDMLELGDDTLFSHKQIGEYMGKVATHIIAIGAYREAYAKGAQATGMPLQIFPFDTSTPLSHIRQKLLQIAGKAPTVILLKGSHSTPISSLARMLIDTLSAKPERNL